VNTLRYAARAKKIRTKPIVVMVSESHLPECVYSVEMHLHLYIYIYILWSIKSCLGIPTLNSILFLVF
jgi:hypothetical protein